MVQGRPGLDVGQPSGRDRTPAGGRVQGARWRAQGAHSRKIKIKRMGPTLTGAGRRGPGKAQGTQVSTGAGGPQRRVDPGLHTGTVQRAGGPELGRARDSWGRGRLVQGRGLGPRGRGRAEGTGGHRVARPGAPRKGGGGKGHPL